jgi:hypothetical protein
VPLTKWAVIGPEYGTVIPVCDGTGPLEYGCDYVEVEAETKRAALVLGVRLLRRQPYLQNYSDENPFTGVRVEPLCPDCNDDGPCLRCEMENMKDSGCVASFMAGLD